MTEPNKPKRLLLSRSFRVIGENRQAAWVSSLSVNDTMHFHQVDGVNLMSTSRNYHYGQQSDQKIHFEHMSTKGSSAEFYRDVYAEISPGLYVHTQICTDSSIDQVLKASAAYIKGLSPETIANYKKSLIRVGREGVIPRTSDFNDLVP